MTSTAETIVVGVDGSGSSVQALRWAARQAQLTGATVHAVTAWTYPVHYGLGGYHDLADEAGKVLSAAVREALGSQPAVPVRESVVAGHAAQALLDAAIGAQLLVLGSHGYGGVTGALLGSISQHCVQHSPCPVVIVRGEPRG
ncbi:universal stress protein [Luedemannella flava]|uniref:Universal stress protein n=1 Tax=Luedemannella flava TaxID=349316 RepID=A0ABN2M328_9ACTN